MSESHMNQSARIYIGCFLFLFIVSGCSKPAANQTETSNSAPRRITSESVVKASVEPVAIVPGQSTEANVRLAIQSGYHVNANPPTFAYLKATELEIVASDGISTSFVTYPSPLTRTLAFADKPLNVYEGATDIKATIKADKAASKGEHSIAAHL